MKSIRNQLQEAYLRAKESFDFDRVQTAMVATNQQWSGGYPSKEHISDTLDILFDDSLVNYLKSPKSTRAATGRLQVIIWNWDTPSVEIMYMAESMESRIQSNY